MPVPPIITPLLQWSDADGNPYAGGSIETYVVGTSTPKATWIDPTQTALNTNPVILDAAGRSLMFGDGDYRLILRDAVGNLIADFPATTLVSAAMYPVVSAPTIADAVHMLGIDDMIEAEAEARAAADAAEQAARIAADNALGVRIDEETAARIAGDADLQSQIDAIPDPTPPTNTIGGGGSTGSSGHSRLTFATPFATSCQSFVATPAGTGLFSITLMVNADRFGADVWATQAGSPIPKDTAFFWLAIGS